MPNPARPNVLLITSDQQHWNTLGCRNPEIQTPQLDRLAARGTIYTRAYCPNPTCTPTRASLITGQYPSQHGAYSLGTKLFEDKLTIGEVFHQRGYCTGLVGKAHFSGLKDDPKYRSLESYPTLRDLDFWRNYKGPFYGFRDFELVRNHADECHVGEHYAIWMEQKGFTEWPRHFQNKLGAHIFDYDGKGTVNPGQEHTWTMPEEFHYNTWIAERTNALMEQYAGQDSPFFMWASFPDPHPPYLVPEPWDKMYDPANLTVPQGKPGEHERNPPHFGMTQTEHPDFSTYQEAEGNGMHGFSSHRHDREALARDIAIYYGMMSFTDKYIGSILDKLEDLGIAQNTIVIFTSDHGHFYGHHGLIAKGPFHYEDVIRVPMIVSWPGHFPEGRESSALQTLVDYPKTFLSLCGIEPPREMTGVDQTPVWKGEKETVRDHITVENRHQPTTIHVKTLVTDRYKLTCYFDHDYGELFDLEDDPGEFNNLWDDPDSQGLKSALLLKLIHAEMIKEPLPMPRVAGA